jgi:hypothetical protein
VLLLGQAALTLPGNGPDRTFRRPPLDWTAPPAAWNSHPTNFQVMNEGDRYWHASQQEYDANYYHDCGPIAVAHAVNFTRAALGQPGTLNASDSIRESIADGGYRWGDQTYDVKLLGKTITRLTGVDVQYQQDTLAWDTALRLARSRWILVNTPGHLSLVLADRQGRDFLELVQYHVNRGGSMDAGDLIITAGEWDAGNWQTLHPLRRLWPAPDKATPTGGEGAPWVGRWRTTALSAPTTNGADAVPADVPPLDSSSPEQFVTTATPYARVVERQRGFPAPVLVAMACNETGYGDARYVTGNNFFGIKRGIGWTGRVASSRTWEVINGRRVETWAEFHAYDSPAASFADFCSFLEGNSRYSGTEPGSGRYRPDWDAVRLRGNPDQLPARDWSERFIGRIIAAGYATDPDYVSKIMRFVDQWRLA